jgi:hypothetical protein
MHGLNVSVIEGDREIEVDGVALRVRVTPSAARVLGGPTPLLVLATRTDGAYHLVGIVREEPLYFDARVPAGDGLSRSHGVYGTPGDAAMALLREWLRG